MLSLQAELNFIPKKSMVKVRVKYSEWRGEQHKNPGRELKTQIIGLYHTSGKLFTVYRNGTL